MNFHTKFSISTVFDEEALRVEMPETNVEANKLGGVMDEIYLGLLAADKYFLEWLVKFRDLRSAMSEAGRSKEEEGELYQLAEDCLGRSRYRRDVMRMSKPMYFFRFERQLRPPGHAALVRQERRLRMHNIIVKADFLLRRLHDARCRRDYVSYFRYISIKPWKYCQIFFSLIATTCRVVVILRDH